MVLLGLFATSLGADPYYQGAQAATSTTANLDGYKINTAGSRIGNFSTAKVTIKKVSTGAVNSSTAQPFYLNTLPATAAGDHYIVSISPTSVTGYTVKGLTWCLNACTGFNEVTSNFRSGSSTDFTFYAGNNYHMRWIFQPVAVPTSTPAPATSKPTLVPSPTPAPTVPTPPPTLTTMPVGAPSGFTATSLGTHAVVDLRWTVASGSVKTYTLERSIDQVVWQTVSDKITDTRYQDKNAGFGTHYYYRLKAVGQDGIASAVVAADVRTPELAGNTDSSRDTTFTSNDRIADITVSAGAIADQADCSLSDSSDAVSVAKGQTKVAGPYLLFCKTRLGETINAFAKPILWTYHLKGHLASSQVPKAIAVMTDGGKKEVSGAIYDKASQDYSFGTSGTGQTMVLGTAAPASLADYGLIGLVLLLVGLGIGALLFIRRPAKRSYEDYIRSKYYDL